MTRLATPLLKVPAKTLARQGPVATSADAFFDRVEEVESRLETVLDAVDSLFASQVTLSKAGGTSMTDEQRRRINQALAFDLQGLRRAVAAAQSIALCGPDDAVAEAFVAPMLIAPVDMRSRDADAPAASGPITTGPRRA